MANREHQPDNAILGMNRNFVPTLPLGDGEEEIMRMTADTVTFWRSQAWMALFFSVVGAGILIGMGNPHWWTANVGAVLAIGVRAFYLGPDERKSVWVLTNQRMMGPQNKVTTLDNITKVNVIWTAVQVVTLNGDKHLIRYQADPDAVKDAIEAAQATSH